MCCWGEASALTLVMSCPITLQVHTHFHFHLIEIKFIVPCFYFTFLTAAVNLSLTVAGKVLDEPDIHLILEYPMGATWGAYTSCRANRYVSIRQALSNVNKTNVFILICNLINSY